MNEYWTLILGGLSIAWYAAAFTFNFLGQFIRWGVTAHYGAKTNPTSPPKFNFRYWWYNNGKKEIIRVLVIAAMVFATLRFSFEWLQLTPSMALACGLGLAVDLLWYFFRKKTEGHGMPAVMGDEEEPKT